MSRPASHDDFGKAGFVSVWLGDALTSEVELDQYLAEQFASDFGFDIYPPAGPE
jgi:hypothetical protein